MPPAEGACEGNFEPSYVDEFEAPVSLLKATLRALFRCCRMGAQVLPAKSNFDAQRSIIEHGKRKLELFHVENLQPKFVLLESSLGAQTSNKFHSEGDSEPCSSHWNRCDKRLDRCAVLCKSTCPLG